MTPMRVRTSPTVDPDIARAVALIADQAQAADGVAPLSEATLLDLAATAPRPGVHHLIVDGDQGPAGYAHLEAADGATPSAEVVVAPAQRRRGVGGALLDTLLQAHPDVHLWAHGYLPAARHVAASRHARVVRELWRMALEVPESEATGPAADVARIRLPEGFTLSTYTAEDEADWLAVNAAAFAHHPEQGRMTAADLHARQAEPWFDPAGFFLVRDHRPGRGGTLAAFHWTKVTPDEGEVYVVGVAPPYQGLGLGRAVTDIGLAHLRSTGRHRITLYVDGDNTAAIATYTRAGFTRDALDVQLAGPTPTG